MGILEKVQSTRTSTHFKEVRSTLNHIVTLHTLTKQEAFAHRCLYSCFFRFHISFQHSSMWQALGMPPTIRHTTSFTTSHKNHVHHILRNNTYQQWHTWWTTVQHWCSSRMSLSPTLFDLYINELETYLDKIDKGSLCLLNIVVVILLHANDVPAL